MVVMGVVLVITGEPVGLRVWLMRVMRVVVDRDLIGCRRLYRRRSRCLLGVFLDLRRIRGVRVNFPLMWKVL